MTKANITYTELEALYGIKRATAYALVSQHRIPHVRLGRRYVLFPIEQIDQWFKEHSVPQEPSEVEKG